MPYLAALPLSAWQYHSTAGSTNDLALAWVKTRAPDRALVIADAQKAGRGRGERRWVTKPSTGLAFSLILRPMPEEAGCVPRFTAMAALGLIHALEKWGLQGQVKWPNDVLLDGKKVAGVLVEADWQGEELVALVVGMGVNVKPESVPPEDELRFPATSVEDALGKGVDRWALLAEIINSMLAYREKLTESAFMEAWNAHLAFLGEWIPFRTPDGKTRRMKVLGVLPDGRLHLEKADGEVIKAVSGEIGMAYNEK
jgi:BirA family biotin operon repressor/biotin-[acetyl-CoA-carboxylase] ligase